MASGQRFLLEVFLDASQVPDLNPAHPVKVVAYLRQGETHERFVNLSRARQGSARFTFSEAPGALTVAIGPQVDSLTDVKNMQAISVDVPASSWQRSSEIKLPVVPISADYWGWWLHLCRKFTAADQPFYAEGGPAFGSMKAYNGDGSW